MEDNIKIHLQEVGCGSMDCIDLAQDSVRWQAVMNAVMNLFFSIKCLEFLDYLKTC